MKTLKVISALMALSLMALMYGVALSNTLGSGDHMIAYSVGAGALMLLPLLISPFAKRIGLVLGMSGMLVSAGYTATVLQDAIYKSSKKDPFQANELRNSVYGAFDVAMKGTPELVPKTTLENIKKSALQTTKINVFQKETLGTGTVRVCAGSGDGTTAQVTISYNTFNEQFGMSLDLITQNQYVYDEIFQKRWENKHRSFYKRWENAAVAYLETKASKGDGHIYQHFGNAKQVPLSDWDISTNRAAQFMNKIKGEMIQNDYAGRKYIVIGNAQFATIWAAMNSQGQSTATALNDQFQDFEFHVTNSLNNDTGVYATCYVFQEGMFGVIPWIKPKNRVGYNIGTDAWSMYNDMRYSMDMEMKYSAKCFDSSGTATEGQDDLVEGFGLTVDLAFLTAYSSDSNTGIYKYELLLGNTISSGS